MMPARVLIFHRRPVPYLETTEARQALARWGYTPPSVDGAWGITAKDQQELIDALTQRGTRKPTGEKATTH